MTDSIVPKTLINVFRVTCLSALCLGAALVSTTTEVRAQHLDPPLGWDTWDPTWSTREIWKGEEADETVRWRKERHQVYIDQGVPKAYRDASNPLSRIPSLLEAGHELYARHCASCHDAGGQGGGDAGLSLFPPPALLVHLIRLPSRVDEYLIWSIAEGGEAFASDMPAFKDALDTEEIWQIITYMRAGFPTVDGEVND
ncbi:MAG: cytochrome c [Alphaproteobacteria bacterium]|nr:cytochrome c [Alphaproteobacteria bacterium]